MKKLVEFIRWLCNVLTGRLRRAESREAADSDGTAAPDPEEII